MASKLRRTPLFSYNDGNLCLSSYPQAPHPQYTPRKKKQPAYTMECGVSANYSPAATNGSSSNAGVVSDVRSERSPAKSGLHVNFTEKGEVKERREKFLTAKYGSHQMSLIRKRLAVEMWLYDELQKLFEISENSKTGEVDVDIDIDELLDMNSDEERRRHLKNLLADAKKSPLEVKKFVDDLLERAKTL